MTVKENVNRSSRHIWIISVAKLYEFHEIQLACYRNLLADPDESVAIPLIREFNFCRMCFSVYRSALSRLQHADTKSNAIAA